MGDLDLTEVPKGVRILARDDDDSRVELIETNDNGTVLAISVVSSSPSIDRTAFVFPLTEDSAGAIAEALIEWCIAQKKKRCPHTNWRPGNGGAAHVRLCTMCGHRWEVPRG